VFYCLFLFVFVFYAFSFKFFSLIYSNQKPKLAKKQKNKKQIIKVNTQSKLSLISERQSDILLPSQEPPQREELVHTGDDNNGDFNHRNVQ